MLLSSMPTLTLSGGAAFGAANGLLYSVAPGCVGTPPSGATASSIGSGGPASSSTTGLGLTSITGGTTGAALAAEAALSAGEGRAARAAGAAHASPSPEPVRNVAYSMAANAMINA